MSVRDTTQPVGQQWFRGLKVKANGRLKTTQQIQENSSILQTVDEFEIFG